MTSIVLGLVLGVFLPVLLLYTPAEERKEQRLSAQRRAYAHLPRKDYVRMISKLNGWDEEGL